MGQQKIRLGIVGYGNLGRGVETAIAKNPDMELVAVFTRRDPASLPTQAKAVSISDSEQYRDLIDVMILCGGSATDIPEQGPHFAQMFNTVDSYDTHAKIPEYFETMNERAQASGHVSIISTGWDPGLFSLNRLLTEAILPDGRGYTFWGKGISQGHSDAVRRVPGVKDAVQYTVPNEEAINQIRAGKQPDLSVRDKHIRECYVVAEPGADLERIEHEIKTMPNYFADYETIVHFIDEEELKRNHSAMPHGGYVIRSGRTGGDHVQMVEFRLQLESNPEFTASVMVVYARAAYKLAREGKTGAFTPFDVPFSYLSPKSPEQLRAELL